MTGPSKSSFNSSISSHARRYDMSIERPAAEMDPWSRTASSSRILPWPIARPGPICVLAPEQLGLTEATVIPKLLDRSTRIGISTPKIDPLGDYTVELYNRIARSHAGEAQNPMERSSVIETPPGRSPPPPRDAFADALQEGRVDLAILYCSGRDRYTRLLPKAAMVSLPPEFQVGPEYALALLKDADPLAAKLALFVLSPEGQATLA